MADEVAVDEGETSDAAEDAEIEAEPEDLAARPRIARSPREPTSQERLVHEVTHIPMRTWCKHCMKGRSRDSRHVRLPDAQEVPRVGMDYMRVSETGVTSKLDEAAGEMGMTMLVMKDFWHKSIWVYPVEGKGVTKADWLAAMIKDDLATCGLDNCMIVVKSDQEPAIRELQEEIARQRRIDGAVGTVTENSRVGDSSSNGRTERAIQEVGGLVRTLKYALEERLGGPIGLDHPVVPWLAKHAAAQISRYQVRANGRTSYQSIKGYACRDPLSEFGECVMFRPLKTNKEQRNKNALAERVLDGIWLGTDLRTSTNIVATDTGVYYVGRVVRKSPSER